MSHGRFDSYFSSPQELIDLESKPERPRLDSSTPRRVDARTSSGPERSVQEQGDLQALIQEQMTWLTDKSLIPELLNSYPQEASAQIEFMTRPLKGDAGKRDRATKALEKIYLISKRGKQNERRAA